MVRGCVLFGIEWSFTCCQDEEHEANGVEEEGHGLSSMRAAMRGVLLYRLRFRLIMKVSISW